MHSPPSPLGAISSPFEYEGQPAVLEAIGGLPPSWLALRVFDGGGWPERGRAPFGALAGARCWPQTFQVVADGTALHAFVQTDDNWIRYAQIEIGTKTPSWEKVAQTRDRWDVALSGGQPTLFLKRIEMWSDQLVGLRRAGPGSWPELLTHRLARAIDLGVVARSAPDRLVVVAGLAPSGLQVTELDAARVVAEHQVGSNPIGWMIKWLYAMQLGLMPLSLGAALVLSRLMLKHRTRELRAGNRRAQHATLARRGLAQTIDYGFTAGPVIVAFATKAGEFDRMMDAGWWIERWWLIALSMGLWAAGVIAFAFMEARWGRTPGKWVLGIRVVTLELQPCRFGRALLRNALLMVDGMFYFVAGLLSIALSEHWQRIGDLAARTVVIEGEPVSAS